MGAMPRDHDGFPQKNGETCDTKHLSSLFIHQLVVKNAEAAIFGGHLNHKMFAIFSQSINFRVLQPRKVAKFRKSQYPMQQKKWRV